SGDRGIDCVCVPYRRAPTDKFHAAKHQQPRAHCAVATGNNQMITRASCILILAGVLVVSVPEFAAGQDPTPSPTPEDARRFWGNTGTNFNADASWTVKAPGAGDVGAFTAAAVITQPQLTASVSIAGLYFEGTGSSGYDLTRTSTQTLTLTGTAIDTTAGEAGNANAAAIGAENTSGTNTIDV